MASAGISCQKVTLIIGGDVIDIFNLTLPGEHAERIEILSPSILEQV